MRCEPINNSTLIGTRYETRDNDRLDALESWLKDSAILMIEEENPILENESDISSE